MGRVSRPTIYLVLIGSAILVAIGLGWYVAHRSPERSVSVLSVSGSDDAPAFERQQVYLYFGDGQGRYLTAEARVVEQTADVAAFCRKILSALFDGPRQGGVPVLPQGIGIRALYITGEGVAYLDFESGAFDDHPGGVQSELLTIYAIVNTLVLNVDGVRSVQFLIGGKEAATLAGHVDLTHPFEADILRVR
jgi:spore germination protein GerM